MPHGLGSGADFGHIPEDVGLSAEELALNAELLGGQPEEENLGPDVTDPFEDGAVGEYLGGETVEGSAEDLEQFLNYLQMAQPEYPVFPSDLVSLVESNIIDVGEARAYLERKGVIG